MESWPRRPERRLAFLASVGLHLLFVLYWMSTLVGPRPPQRSLIELPVASDTTAIDLDLTYAPSAATRGRDQGRRRASAPEAAIRREGPEGRFVGARRAGRDTASSPSPSGPADSGRAVLGDTTGFADEAGAGRIGPQYAQGRLWVRPLPLPAQELAQRLTGSRKALADSVVNRAVQIYLDSIAADPNTPRAGMPSWTTKLAGKSFGIDGKYIYFAGLKIPAAVLALLPISFGGQNFDRDRAWRHMMDLRTDLQQAAMRSANQAEFKQAIKEIRERKERDEEFQRNQATAPGAGSPAASPPPPPPPAAAKPDLTPTP